MRRHYATLPGNTESYSEHTQTRTFENHANLLAYLANRPLSNGLLPLLINYVRGHIDDLPMLI